MKKAPLKILRIVLLIILPYVFAHAQGTVNFANVGPPGVNAPVYESDGITPLSGPQFIAELLVGTSANSLASVAMTGFLTGIGAGYFNDGTVTLSGISTFTTVWVQVDVWNTASGATFDQAKASGVRNSWWQSSQFTVVVGGPTANGGFPPAPLTGLGNSPVYLNGVPEPSVLALVGLGMVVVVLAYRPFRYKRRPRRS